MIPLKDHNPTHRFAWLTAVLIAACVYVFVAVQPTSRVGITEGADPCTDVEFTVKNAAVPDEVVTGEPLSGDEVRELVQGQCEVAVAGDEAVFPEKRVWLAMVVSMFLHGSWLHLGGNMLFLWVFGNNIEDHWGKVAYLVFYLLSGLAATVGHVAVQPNSVIPVVGASGAIAGVMGAYLVLFPKIPIKTLFTLGFFIFLRDVPAWLLLGFWFISQFFINPNAGVAWMAHVGGFVFGVAIGLIVRAARPPERPREMYSFSQY